MKKQRIWRFLVVFGLILGIKDGYIALYDNGKTVNVYPYQARFLPEADQQMLEKGIPVHERSDLTRLLEDYLS